MIGWVQDINPWIDIGGAQANDLKIIRWLMQGAGLDIDIIVPENVGHKLTKKYELLIISNCTRFPRDVLEKLTAQTPYIIFHHDYVFYRFRLFYPMVPEIRQQEGMEWWAQFFRKARKNIFLSPLHRDAFKAVFTDEELGETATIPSALDVDFWHADKDIIRKPNTVICVNGLEIYKGRYPHNQYVLDHPEMEFTFVGGGNEINKPNAKYIQQVSPEDLRKLYSEHEYCMMLPENPEPFCRVVMEAYLCRCKIIKNENVGAFSYPWDFNNKAEVIRFLKQSSVGFSDEVYTVLNKIRGLA